jgi:hypothetical protein
MAKVFRAVALRCRQFHGWEKMAHFLMEVSRKNQVEFTQKQDSTFDFTRQRQALHGFASQK